MKPLPFILLIALATHAHAAPRPHIVFFLADDLGWKDVGYHQSEIKTPNIDKLSAAGVRLEQFYVQPVCSPTRAALLTGRYPMRHGLQVGVVRPWARYGLPLTERTLADALRSAGYRTAIVGKWHLGHFDPAYLPTKRGFDHQYGHYKGALDYWTHIRDGGLDWHRGDKVLREEGYTTQLLAKEAVRLIDGHDIGKPLFLYLPFNAPHAPLQAPKDYLDRYKHIERKQRRTYAAMVSCLDDAIGSVVAALEKKGMTKNTLLVFSTDNGGPVKLGANNGPLRNGKGSLYEGGVRGVAWASWPGKLKPGVVQAPLHMVDWYPTLLKLGGASLEQKTALDGKDLWPTIAEGKPSPHDDILLNVTPRDGALRTGDWKLVAHGKWPSPGKVELFNLAGDLGEKSDLAQKHPDKVKTLLDRLNGYGKQAGPPRGGGGKPKGFKSPKVWGEKE
jgi:arylsulfatase A-like enzyme